MHISVSTTGGFVKQKDKKNTDEEITLFSFFINEDKSIKQTVNKNLEFDLKDLILF